MTAVLRGAWCACRSGGCWDAARRGNRSGLGRVVAGVVRLLPLALLALLSGCGAAQVPEAVAEPQPSAHQLWTVDATLLQNAQQPLTACYFIRTSLPPAGCSGVQVRGVDLHAVQGVQRFPTRGTTTTPALRLVGTYADGVLTVVRQPTAAPAPTPSPTHPAPPVSCAPPPGGWPYHRASQAGFQTVVEYVRRQSDGGTPRIDDSQRIMTAPFTGNLERHRQALAELYDGPVCVEQARASQRQLEALRESVHTQLESQGHLVLSSASGNAFGTLEVTVVAATDQEGMALQQQHDGLVEVTSFLQPL